MKEEKGAEFYDKGYSKPYDTSVYDALYSAIVDVMLPTIRNVSVLEAGCGVGDLGLRIIEKGIPYVGYDVSRVAVDLCVEKSLPVWVGTVYEPKNYVGEQYNTVLFCEVLEHVDDLKALEAVPKGKTVVISVPNFPAKAHLRTYPTVSFIMKRFHNLLKIPEGSFIVLPHHRRSWRVFLFKAARI